MDNNNNDLQELYSNKERKRELVLMLEKLLETQREASEALTEKAWELLRIASTIVGVVFALQLALDSVRFDWAISLVLAIIFGLYYKLYGAVIETVDAREWRGIPGTDSGEISYQELVKKYVPVNEEIYLDKLIVDYAGKYEGDEYLPGALHATEESNREKAQSLRNAAYWLKAILGALVFISLVMVTAGLIDPEDAETDHGQPIFINFPTATWTPTPSPAPTETPVPTVTPIPQP